MRRSRSMTVFPTLPAGQMLQWSAMAVEKATIKTANDREISGGEQVPIPCFRCGICCTCYQPSLLPEDIEKIASTLSISVSAFISGYALQVPTKEGYLLRQNETGCMFLARDEGEKARCTIHPARPKACREWQPSLARPACLEGLARLKAKGQLALLDDLFASEEERRDLRRSLEKAALQGNSTEGPAPPPCPAALSDTPAAR